MIEFEDHAVNLRGILEVTKKRLTDHYDAHPGDIENIIKDKDAVEDEDYVCPQRRQICHLER